MKKLIFLPFAVLTCVVSTAVIAGGNSLDASTSLFDSSDTAIITVTPVVEGLSVDSSTADVGLSTTSSVTSATSVSETGSSTALDTSSALTDGQATGGFEAFEDEAILIDISSLLDSDRIGLTSLQWEVDRLDGQGWIILNGANSPVFIPGQEHVGHSLRAQLSYTDGKGSVENLVSPATNPVQNINDPPLGQLDIIGNPLETKVLRVNVTGVRDEDGAGVTSFEWEGSLDGIAWTPLSSTDSALVLTQAEVGLYVRSIVSYVDNYGHPESVTSEVAGPIGNVNNNVVGTPTIAGIALEGETLTLKMADLTDPDGVLSENVYWESSVDNIWSHIPGANSKDLELTRYLTGVNVRAVVSIVDRFGSVENTASAQVGPIKAINIKPSGMLVLKRTAN
jgi:hypothetical protein|tara:strand:- start:57 stop:1241 length:1185 start_codon:yes stop_codon:yes gene_type:complete